MPTVTTPTPVQVQLFTHLKEQVLGINVIHQTGVVFVHHGQLGPRGADVQTSHRRTLLQQHDGKCVVHKYLHYLQKQQT